MRGGQRLMVDLEARLRETSGIPSLKLRYTRVFGWYIEVTRSAPGQGAARVAPQADHRQRRALHVRRARRARRQAGSRRGARDVARDRALRGLVRHLAASRRAPARRLVAPGRVGRRRGSRRGGAPRRLDAPRRGRLARARARGRRHPVVEKLAAAGRFVPNDVALGAGEGRPRLWLVTGPNMAGKSTLMRQAALAGDPGADGGVRAGAQGAYRRRRSRAHARRRERQPLARREHLHGGDEGDRQRAAPGDAPLARRARRDSAAARAPTTAWRSRGQSPSTCMTSSPAERCSRRTTTSSPSSPTRGRPPARTGASAHASTKATSSSSTSCSAELRRAATAWPARGSQECPSPCSRGRARCSASSSATALPSGAPASLRARSCEGRAQLGLFHREHGGGPAARPRDAARR